MSTPLTWHEKSPGVYQRGIDAVERFYFAINSTRAPGINKADWHISMGVKLEYSQPEFVNEIRTAWIKSRYDFPSLAATIDTKNDIWVYRTADNQDELDEWLNETFHVHQTHLTARQLMSKEVLVPTSRAAIHVFPDTKELLLQSPHAHVDGFGAIKTLQHIISCLNQASPTTTGHRPAQFGDEHKNLTPPMSITCPTPPLTPTEQKKWNALMDEFIKSSQKIFLSPQNHTLTPGYSRILSLQFDPASTKTLQQSARSLSVSLSAIIQSAVSLAALEHGGYNNTAEASSKPTRHAIQVLYNVSSHVDASIVPAERIVSPMVLGVPLTYSLEHVSDSFADLAREAHAVIQSGKVDAFGLKCAHLWGTDLPRAFMVPLPEGKVMRAEAQVSNLGVVDGMLGDWNNESSGNGTTDSVKCVDFWPGLDILSGSVVMWPYVFRGRMTFTVAYNEVYHAEESMARYLGLIKDNIDRGLGVETRAVGRRPGEEEWRVGGE